MGLIACERGAAKLAPIYPDWYERLDKRVLDTECPRNCPLGQLFGSFHLGLGAVGLAWEQAFLHGFSGGQTNEWIRLIDIRLGLRKPTLIDKLRRFIFGRGR